MTKKTLLVQCCAVVLLASLGCGQKERVPEKKTEEETPAAVADLYLQGVKTIDLPEGKQQLLETAWRLRPDDTFPVFTEATTLFEGTFPTDIEGIQGYKRLTELKTLSKGGIPLLKRYLLIAYQDRRFGKWKVYDFREAADAAYEAQEAGARLGDTRYVTRQINYRNYGYWLAMAGKIDEARQAFQKASQLNRETPDRVPQSEFDAALEVIRQITGGETDG